jgi:hypothetical protein
MSETYAYRVKLDRSAKNNGQTYFDNMSEQFLALLRKFEVCFYAYYEHCECESHLAMLQIDRTDLERLRDELRLLIPGNKVLVNEEYCDSYSGKEVADVLNIWLEGDDPTILIWWN